MGEIQTVYIDRKGFNGSDILYHAVSIFKAARPGNTITAILFRFNGSVIRNIGLRLKGGNLKGRLNNGPGVETLQREMDPNTHHLAPLFGIGFFGVAENHVGDGPRR